MAWAWARTPCLFWTKCLLFAPTVGWRIWKGIRKSSLHEDNREWSREAQEHSSSLKLYQVWVPMVTPLLPNYIGPDTLIMCYEKNLSLSELLWEVMAYLWSIWHTDLNINVPEICWFSYFSFQYTFQPGPCSVSAALSLEQCETPNMLWRSIGHETGKHVSLSLNTLLCPGDWEIGCHTHIYERQLQHSCLPEVWSSVIGPHPQHHIHTLSLLHEYKHIKRQFLNLFLLPVAVQDMIGAKVMDSGL